MPKYSAQRKKSVQKKIKNSPRSKKINTKLLKTVILSGVFVLSTLVISGYIVYKNLTKNLAAASSANSYDIKAENIFTLNFVTIDSFASENPQILSSNLLFFDTKNKKVVAYTIDPNTQIDVSGKYAKEPVKKILSLGMSIYENDFDKSIMLYNQSIRNLYGYSIDKHLIISEDLSEPFKSLFLHTSSFNLDAKLLTTAQKSMKTNLNINEFIYIYKYMNLLPKDRFIIKDLTSSYLENISYLDDEMLDLTFDSTLALEKKSIAILNGSGLANIATMGTRAVQNMGGRVTETDNALNYYDESIIITEDTTSETVKKLSHYFGINNIITKADYLGNRSQENAPYRSDVTVILGVDTATTL